jgi:single-strand DNA-binding protein
VKKGSFVRVQGQLRTRKWTDNAGQEHYTTEIVLAKFNGEIGLLDAAPNRSDTDYGQTADGIDLDDDIPF